MPRRAVLATLAALVLLAPAVPDGHAAAPPEQASVADQNFRVDWTAGAGRRGAGVVSGYVVNRTPQQIMEIRLAVDVLDPAGQPTGTVIHRLRDEIPAFDRAYFQIPVRTPGSSYRVRVLDWAWRGNP